MTEKQQRRYYFPNWQRCASVHDWRMVKGRLASNRLTSCGRAEATTLYHQVWDAAEDRAAQNHRAVSPDDLRHGCHVVALGQDKSSIDLDNPELDRVVSLFRLLADPEDLDALLAWLHPSEAERKRLVWSITNAAPFAYIDSIARDKFPDYTSPFWEDLPMPELRQLHLTLKNRRKTWPPKPKPQIIEHSLKSEILNLQSSTSNPSDPCSSPHPF